MTSNTMKRARKIAKLPLDLPMAALAAASVAFVAYAMPDDLFSRGVGLTGLPSVLAAAEPPLGATARLAVIAAGAAGTFLVVWLLLRALGRPSAKARRLAEEEAAMAPPRLRRADAHPDAPSRRPLIAGLDLGEPFDALPHDEQYREPEEEPEALTQWEPSLPAFMQVEPDPREEEEAEELELQAEEAFEEDEPQIEEPVAEDRFANSWDEAPATEAYAEPEPEPEPEFTPEPVAEYSPPAAPVAAPVVPAAAGEQPSIAHLMQRLERGLDRRRPGDGFPAEAALELRTPAKGRLRSALDDLQKRARRGG